MSVAPASVIIAISKLPYLRSTVQHRIVQQDAVKRDKTAPPATERFLRNRDRNC
jgi:hypothetical protein